MRLIASDSRYRFRLNGSDIAVEHFQVIVVPPVDHPVARPENPFPYRQLMFPFFGRIGSFLDHLVQARVPKLPLVIGERIWISVFFPKYLGIHSI